MAIDRAERIGGRSREEVEDLSWGRAEWCSGPAAPRPDPRAPRGSVPGCPGLQRTSNGETGRVPTLPALIGDFSPSAVILLG